MKTQHPHPQATAALDALEALARTDANAERVERTRELIDMLAQDYDLKRCQGCNEHLESSAFGEFDHCQQCERAGAGCDEARIYGLTSNK